MKIGVIGAAGKAGALIAAEARSRGHEVCAIVRDKGKLAGTDYRVIEKSLFDLNAGDLKGLAVVISAFGTPFDGSADEEHIKAAEHLIRVFQELPETRLIVIGGAASLFQDVERKRLVLDTIPEAYRGVPAAAARSLEQFRKSDIPWTFFSPAVTFDPAGPRTGKYGLGTDVVFQNKGGESYLSYADAAIALVDEAENGYQIRKRFTAVTQIKPGQQETGYYGPLKQKPLYTGLGLARYRQPFNFELAGRQFKLIMDYDDDFYVRFLSGNYLEWGVFDEAPQKYYYECNKAEETTYFVNFEQTGANPRTGITLILDLEQRLVTLVKTHTRFSKKHPNLVNSDFDFGALDIEGYPLNRKRHGYTMDLVGKRILWAYQPDFAIIHVYYHSNYVRATFQPETFLKVFPTPESRESWNPGGKHAYDEKATYIKIKENVYLVELVEQNMAKAGWTGNSLLFLMELGRVHDVGRSFGYVMDPQRPGETISENYLFTGYGDFMPSDGTIEKAESIYR
jgi:putative NADH-flavin reductase